MSDVVVDSSVVAKWILPESDSPQAHRLFSDVSGHGERLIVLDLALTEVSNAIWKRQRQKLFTPEEASRTLDTLLRIPVHLETSIRLLPQSMDIATKYDRAIYDALFVALAHDLGLKGVTADEPLFRAVHADFPSILLLRDW